MFDFLLSATTGDPVLLLIIVSALLFAIVLLFIPGLLAAPSAKPEEIGHAVVCYLLQAFGIILMVSAAFPVLVGILSSITQVQMVSVDSMMGPGLLFAAGVLILVHFSKESNTIDNKAAAGVRGVFMATFRLLGCLLAILSLLSFGLTLILTGSFQQWEMMCVLFLTGMLFSITFSPIQQKKGMLSKVRGKK